jgi:hypothetical protein
MSQAMLPADVVAVGDDAAVLRSLGLQAEYSVGQTEAGEWFAIGSVRCASASHYHPAWVIVGTGVTSSDAVAALRLELESEARHVLVTT